MGLAGELASLSAALLWAVAVTMFRGPIAAHGARTVNLVKCLLAAVLQGLTVLAVGQIGALRAAPPEALLLIAVSGIVGLVVGDTALFAAVARIGVHRTLLLQTLGPVFAALLAAVWLGERIGSREALGALTILAGVALVVAPRRRTRTLDPDPGRRGPGLAAGVLAALGQGAGLVIAKQGMQQVPVLAASFLRLAAAAVALLVLAGLLGRLRAMATLATSAPAMTRVVPATLLGTYLALFLMMAGIAWAPASVAAVLLSTSPVFSLILEAVRERRVPDVRGIVGTLAAIAGIGILTWNGA